MWIEGNINPAVSWENGDVFEHRRRTVVMDDRRRRSPLLRWIIEWMGCPANESWLFWTSRERERANIEKKKKPTSTAFEWRHKSNGNANSTSSDEYEWRGTRRRSAMKTLPCSQHWLWDQNLRNKRATHREPPTGGRPTVSATVGGTSEAPSIIDSTIPQLNQFSLNSIIE